MKLAVVHNQPLGTREAGLAFVAGAATGFAQVGVATSLLLPGGGAADDLTALGVPSPPPFALPVLPRIAFEVGPFRPSWSAPFRRAVVRTVASFDVAIVRDLKIAALLLAARPKARLIYEMHNVYSLVAQDDRDAALFPADKLAAHRERAAWEADVLARVDGVIVLTDGLRARLEPHFGLAGRVGVGGSALHPVDAPPSADDAHDVAYIGSLDPHKGVGLLVDALTHLPEVVRLRLIGHGRHHEALLDLARRRGVAERLVLAGWSSPAGLPAALHGCFAAAVPLEDCFYNRYVTSPMKLFDYARAGVVPVVPDLPVFAELFATDAAAELVPAGDSAAIAAALLRLHEDAPYRAAKRRSLAAFAAAHTWRARAAALLPFLNDLPPRVR